jgi:hypothetical protein
MKLCQEISKMKEIKLTSWEEFEAKIKELLSKMEKLRKEKDQSYISYPLFRGQSDSSWRLKTTLDRIRGKASCFEYHLIMEKVKSHVESITGMYWDLPLFKESDGIPMPPEGYPFMVYLRHHQFPSPLLDWTRSPYIAAFFAFDDIRSQNDVEIFAYLETLGHGKSWGGNQAKITTLGPNVRTHKRHYLQQSEYTICTKKENGNNFYWNHEEVFDVGNEYQDLLTKYIIPISEKQTVLKKLDLMNINAYSLFHNEEGLMHTLAIKEFIINDR